MFTFGSSPVLDLDNARLFAQQFQLEEDRPTLRRIARANALCHHDLVQCLDASSFIVRSQNDPDVQYEVVSTEGGYQCTCLDPVVPCKHIIACRWILHCYQALWCLSWRRCGYELPQHLHQGQEPG